jgi:hypothetical protein
MGSISGIELSRRFYDELVRPWLAGAFPDLRHAAALLGAGSELLGFDDEMSRDHDWGPRLQIFVSENDFAGQAYAIVAAFADIAPQTFLGAPIGFRVNGNPRRRAPGPPAMSGTVLKSGPWKQGCAANCRSNRTSRATT